MSLRFVCMIFAAVLAIPAGLVVPAAAEGERVEQLTITSFDGTQIAATLFAPAGADEDNRVPFVLMTHGWAGSRTSTFTGRVADLVGAGYGVLTWDSRGFGASGGEVMLNDPSYEGQDVRVLIDWLVAKAPVAMEGPRDPVIGMSGGSYAGGIQLLAAAFDPRIDVIAPEITWNDLSHSLAPNDVVKTQWVSLLFGGGAATSCSQGHSVSTTPSGCQTSALARYYATVMATNGVTAEIHDALMRRSPATYMDSIDVPTLLVQGFPDTLFDVDQAVANYEGIKDNGAPVKLWLYDGGHAGPGTQSGLISGVVIDWFDCHLKTPSDCSDVGPEIEYYAGGAWRTTATWPPTGTAGIATVAGIPPMFSSPMPAGNQGQWVIPLETSPATDRTIVAGRAVVSFEAIATTQTPAVLHASLGVQNAAGAVTRVDAQTQPLRIVGDGVERSYDIELVSVAAAAAPGEKLVMTLTTFDAAYNNARGAGFVYLENVAATWSSFRESVPPVVVPLCGADPTLDDALPTEGLAVGVTMDESAYDPLSAVSAGVGGKVIVVRDGARLDGAFVTIVISRDVWAGNLGREVIVTGTTNAEGAVCFEVPTAFALPGGYRVRATADDGAEYATGQSAYAVGA